MSGLVLAFSTDRFHTIVASLYDEEAHGEIERFADVSALRNPDALAARLAGSNPDVIAVGPDLPSADALVLVRELDRLYPEISVVLVETPTADLWRAALLAGARDIIDPASDVDTIVAALDRASGLAYERRESIGAKRPPVVVTAPKGRMVVVISPKGGSGKTVIATNVAVRLAKRFPGDVVLVDLDLQFGDVASSLGLTPTYSMYTATQASGSEAALLKAYLTPHSSQLLVLCAPDDPTEADDVKEGDAVRIVQELARLFAWVIIDTGAGLDDLTLAVAEVASDLILVSSTDVPSVRGIRKESMIMDQLGVRATRHFVLNRSDAKVGLSPADISLATGFTIAASIPSSRSVPTSVNVGVAIIDHDGRNPASRGLSALADLLVESEHNTTARKGLRRFRK